MRTRTIQQIFDIIMKKIKEKCMAPSDSLSFISGEYEIFREIEKKTLEKNRARADNLIEHMNNWIDCIRPMIKNNPELSRSLVGIRFIGVFIEMRHTIFSLFSGCYFQAMRNLRYIFELMIHAYYVESKYKQIFPEIFFELMNHPDNEIDFQERLVDRLRSEYPNTEGNFRDITGFKTTIIDTLPVSSNEKEDLKRTYKNLSRHVHPAPEQIRKIIENPDLIFTFYYNEKFFNECIELTDNVMDITFALMLRRFPDMKEIIKIKDNELLFISLIRLPITNRLLTN